MTITILCWQPEGTASTTGLASRRLQEAAKKKVSFSQPKGVKPDLQSRCQPWSFYETADPSLTDLVEGNASVCVCDVCVDSQREEPLVWTSSIKVTPRRHLLHLLFLLYLHCLGCQVTHIPFSPPSHHISSF